jgi:4-aminobutyrate aminotransferase-like enzyme/Ser/Thr protein kinase RdoA (MazF antagonist)
LPARTGRAKTARPEARPATGGATSALAALRPRFRPEQAAAILRDRFGLAASRLVPLPSERDQNFKVDIADGGCYLLKIARRGEREDELAMQNAAIARVAEREPSVPIPRVLPDRTGSLIVAAETTDGTLNRARLLSFLPGRSLSQARPRSPRLLRDLGGVLGRLTRALEGFSHPAAAGRQLDWHPEALAGVIRRHGDAVAEPERRTLLERSLRLHEATVAPLARSLRRSVIHNDANDDNVLVGEPGPDGCRVSGLLDFGDMVESWTVAELAVGVAYAILGSPLPLAAAREVVAGYDEAFALTDDELAVLFGLVVLRLAASVCLSALRARTDPDEPYLTSSEDLAWEALERLLALHPRLAHYALREACGRPAVPRGPAVLEALRAHTGARGPLVQPDLSRATIVDLSVGSPLFGRPEEACDLGSLGRIVEEALRGSQAGLGRYDEARLVYASEAFRGPGGEHPEQRTVHLGLDVFVPPGSPVLAPLAGRVHSFRDNASPYDYGPTVVLEHDLDAGLRLFTLYGHLSADSLANLEAGRTVARGERIGRVGSPPSNGGWPPHVHFQLILDLLDQEGDFPGVAAPTERGLWLALSPDPRLVLQGLPPEATATEAEGALAARRREILSPSLSLHYRRPLTIVRGYMQHLYDRDGRVFLDAVNNVPHVGHGHPRVVEAGRRQMAVLNTNTRYLHERVVEYAERLAATLPEPLHIFFFVNSGSEANELALRLARAHSGGTEIVVVEGAYHGNTDGLVAISPYKFRGPGGAGRPPHVHAVPMPDAYRGRYRRDEPRIGERYAAHVAEALDEVRARGGRAAAFIAESVLGSGGQIVLPEGYLRAAYRHARAAGAVTIADEVQVGFGRVGTRFWGFETQGVVPDIVTLGKPMGNGHPIGAVVTTAQIAASFAKGMEFFSTFGGNPVSATIGLAVLDVIRDEGLQERARTVGGRLLDGLRGLVERHPIVGDARGLGLFVGIELVRDREAREPAAAEAAYLAERMRDHGILVTTDGPDENVVKMKPPLCFSAADADRLVETLDLVLREDALARA